MGRTLKTQPERKLKPADSLPRGKEIRGCLPPSRKRLPNGRWRLTRLSLLEGEIDYFLGEIACRGVIKQTLEMQSESISATRDPLKEACLARVSG
jgi:hypothetical protein